MLTQKVQLITIGLIKQVTCYDIDYKLFYFYLFIDFWYRTNKRQFFCCLYLRTILLRVWGLIIYRMLSHLTHNIVIFYSLKYVRKWVCTVCTKIIYLRRYANIFNRYFKIDFHFFKNIFWRPLISSTWCFNIYFVEIKNK